MPRGGIMAIKDRRAGLVSRRKPVGSSPGSLGCRLEGSPGPLARFVQFILEGVDLPLDLLKGRALWGDEQTPVLAPDVAQESYLDGCRSIRGSGLDVEGESS